MLTLVSFQIKGVDTAGLSQNFFNNIRQKQSLLHVRVIADIHAAAGNQ